jgi:TatD DNase family protein
MAVANFAPAAALAFAVAPLAFAVGAGQDVAGANSFGPLGLTGGGRRGLVVGANMSVFFDTHAHLDYPEYEKDFAEVLARAQAAGIAKIISIGTSLDSSRRAVALAERHPAIYAAVGWHPSEALEAPADLRPALRELARHPKVVAIGETGLDYYRLPSMDPESWSSRFSVSGDKLKLELQQADLHYKQRQAEIFQQQLEVAAEFGLNAIIHQRASFDDTLAQLKPFAGKVRGVFHCFGESVERLQQVLASGSLVSYTGIVTFKNGQNIRDAVAATPLGQFMLETDCPYLAPVPYRGQRCEPAYVKEIAATVAQVKQISLEELSAATCRTAREFFPKL